MFSIQETYLLRYLAISEMHIKIHAEYILQLPTQSMQLKHQKYLNTQTQPWQNIHQSLILKQLLLNCPFNSHSSL